MAAPSEGRDEQVFEMVTLTEMRRGTPVTPKPMAYLVRGFGYLLQSFPTKNRFFVEGYEPPGEPVLFAMNHTHQVDFFPIRAVLHDHYGELCASWTMLETYEDPLMRAFLQYSGNVPLGSRRYVINSDFEQVVGRSASKSEYRKLRSHVDEGTELPDGEPYGTLQSQPRTVLDWSFEPSRSTYREMVNDLYSQMMATTLRFARRGIEEGVHMHICPSGEVTPRLTEGRIGAIQAAIALDLPIVPVGASGCREVFEQEWKPWMTGEGDVTLRFGEEWRPPEEEIPSDFRPFDPEHEQKYGDRLRAWTEEIMDRINELLEPRYQRAEGKSDP